MNAIECNGHQNTHCHGGAKLKNICRTVQVLPECLRLSKVPAVHCNTAKTMGQPGNPE